MISLHDDLIWMANHWWLFTILILLIVWMFFELKNPPQIEEGSYFDSDFSGDFSKEFEPEEIIEQGRNLQKKYDDAWAMFLWPSWIWKYLKKKWNGHN